MSNTTITDISAEEILDSRGNPTLEVTVRASSGMSTATSSVVGVFGVPSGASTGAHEAHELRDGDMTRYGGMGVLKAIENIKNKIAPALHGVAVNDQKKIDTIMLELDGTTDKSSLGGNAMIGVSIACAKAAGNARGSLENSTAGDERTSLVTHLRTLADIKPSRPEPLLFMNLINGGKHARTRLTFQEYLIVPQVDSARQALEIGVTVQKALRDILVRELGTSAAGFGDEGGFVPDLDSTLRPLELLTEALKATGNEKNVKLAIDAASSSFYSDGAYMVENDKLSAMQLMDMYKKMAADFNMCSFEDPFDEEDFDSFAALKAAFATNNPEKNSLVVGDDLTVTNVTRLTKAIEKKSVSAIIVKPNQIGTLTETLATMKLARDNDIHCIVSHRSGETNDGFIADLALAFGAYGLKAGAPERGERVAKYDRLMHIIGIVE
jgi:enolase